MENEQLVDLNEPSDLEIEEVLKELNCPRCFGRGYVGWTLSNDPVMCSCVKKRIAKMHPSPLKGSQKSEN